MIELPSRRAKAATKEHHHARHRHAHRTTTATKPEPKKFRIISLTNRSPIQIVEADWPVIAQGSCGEDVDGPPWGWSMNIRVRKGNYYGPHYVIAARYERGMKPATPMMAGTRPYALAGC